MPLDFIWHEGNKYPALQSTGQASRFAAPFFKEICKGEGLDIGANREEWKFGNSWAIDPVIDVRWDALNLPDTKDGLGWDYLASSHFLEHSTNYVQVLEYWKTKLKHQGILFLYLPHKSQTYWRCHSNRKHLHEFSPKQIKETLIGLGYRNVHCTKGYDLNHSFYALAEK